MKSCAIWWNNLEKTHNDLHILVMIQLLYGLSSRQVKILESNFELT